MQRLPLEPEDCHGDYAEGAVALAAPLVAGGQAAELPDAVAQAVGGLIERAGPAVVVAEDRVSDTPAAVVDAPPSAGVALGADYSVGRTRRPPGPRRLTAPCSSHRSKAITSWRWPGGSTAVRSSPPSARTCTFVEKPPWPRPTASASGPLPRPRAGGHALGRHPRTGPTSPPARPRRPGAAHSRRDHRGPKSGLTISRILFIMNT